MRLPASGDLFEDVERALATSSGQRYPLTIHTQRLMVALAQELINETPLRQAATLAITRSFAWDGAARRQAVQDFAGAIVAIWAEPETFAKRRAGLEQLLSSITVSQKATNDAQSSR